MRQYTGNPSAPGSNKTRPSGSGDRIPLGALGSLEAYLSDQRLHMLLATNSQPWVNPRQKGDNPYFCSPRPPPPLLTL